MSDVVLTPVREAHRFDERALTDFLRQQVPEFAHGMEVEQFEGGQSNPTYRVEAGGTLTPTHDRVPKTKAKERGRTQSPTTFKHPEHKAIAVATPGTAIFASVDCGQPVVVPVSVRRGVVMCPRAVYKSTKRGKP